LDDSKLIFKRALELLSDAKYTFNGDRYNTSISRSYYAVFYGAKALLVKKGIITKTHSGTINKFGLECVVNGDFDKKIAKILSELEEERSIVDYDYEFYADKIRAKEDLINAEKFLKECEKFI
jgi:uncharacterized protein (UPF0332 family)